MSANREDDPREQSMAELLRQLTQEVGLLVRQEVQLAKALLREEVDGAKTSIGEDIALARDELAEKGRRAGRAAEMLGAAGVAALLALGTLTACVVLALAHAMDDWLAALIVGAVWAVIAAGLGLRGRQALRDMGSPMPTQAVRRLKHDVENVAEGLREDAGESAGSIKEDVEWARTRS